MAVVIARQKMTVAHAEGEHTIFPSAGPQSLSDHLIDHPYVQGAIQSGWITVIPSTAEPEPEKTESAPAPRRRRSA